jgi:DNA-binding response OmpR family regulator
MRILILEDEPVCMRFIARVLRNAGYATLEASSSEQAIRLCAENNGSVSLLVADVFLPPASGIDTALMLKAVWPSMRVLFTSATPQDAWKLEDWKKAASIPDALFLGKPFYPSELLRMVESLLAVTRPSPVLCGNIPPLV